MMMGFFDVAIDAGRDPVKLFRAGKPARPSGGGE